MGLLFGLSPRGCHGARVIYLSGASLCFGTRAAYPPAMSEQLIVVVSRGGDSNHAPVYMALQPIRRAAYHVTMIPGGLLPHLFTISFIMRNKGCYFLSRYSAVADSSLLESMVLCVARTFLLPLRNNPSASDTTVLLRSTKLQINFKNILVLNTFYCIFTK